MAKACIYSPSTRFFVLAADISPADLIKTAGRGAGFSRFLLLAAGQGESLSAGGPCTSRFRYFNEFEVPYAHRFR